MRHDSLCLRARAFMSARVCLLALIFAIIWALALAAPSTRAQTTTPQYLFVVTGVPDGSGGYVNGIKTFTVDTTTGALTQITPPPVQTRAQPSALAIDNAGTFLFAVGINSGNQGAVESFSVASDGSLTEVGTSPYTVSNPLATPVTLAVSPNGEYLYVASTVAGSSTTPTPTPESTILDVFAVAADGSLTLSNTFAYSAVEACNPPTPALLFPVQLYVHPTQKWLYLFMGSVYGPPCSGQPSEVQPFTINSDGTLTPETLDILPLYATNGYALTGSPDGTLLFLMTKQNPEEGIIYASAIDQSTGDVDFTLAGSYPPNGPMPALSTGGLAVDSTSTYLYSSAGTFQIQDGAVTLLGSISSPYTVGASLLASPSLPLIFAEAVTSGGSNFLSDLVNGDGSLTPAPGSPYTISGGGMVLSGATPIPTKPVMWINPDGPINITGVPVGQTASPGLTISNVGYGPLAITSVTVTGDPSLTPTNLCTTPVAPPTGTCSAGVTFTPTAVGTFTGTLTIVSNVGTRTFAISATSVTPPPPMPDPIFVAPSPILFPDTASGSSSSLTFTLENGASATGPMTVSSITLGGSNPGDFSQMNTCTSPVPAGSSCSVTVIFTPQALGGRAATLSINGPSGALTGAQLTGTGVPTVTKFTFSTSVTGPGTITQSPTGTSFANNTTVSLTAVPSAGATFSSWGGACTNTGSTTCSVIVTSNTAVSATFTAPQYTLTTSVNGPGAITQSPTGTSFASGTAITLTAVPNTGATFTSWSGGACAGSTSSTCAFNISANTSVTATFLSPPAVTTPDPSQTGAAGGSFTFSLSATGFSTAPTYTATCSIPAGSCTINGTTLVVTTTARTSMNVHQVTAWVRPSSGVGNGPRGGNAGSAAAGVSVVAPLANASMLLLAVLAEMMLVGIANARAATAALRLRRIAPALAILVAFAGLALLAACGGSGGGTTPSGTPAGTYTVAITATAGTQKATTSVSVTVQ